MKLAPPGGLFNETVVGNLFPYGSAGARKQLVHRAVASGEISRLKPGLFALRPEYRRTELHPYAVAAFLHSPSHVSLESRACPSWSHSRGGSADQQRDCTEESIIHDRPGSVLVSTRSCTTTTGRCRGVQPRLQLVGVRGNAVARSGRHALPRQVGVVAERRSRVRSGVAAHRAGRSERRFDRGAARDNRQHPKPTGRRLSGGSCEGGISC